MDTATRILETAEHLMQSRGYNGFSYADIAGELDLTKASLHHHFATKEALGEALIARYQEKLLSALAAIDEKVRDPAKKLARYADLYAAVLGRQRLCLCGMLAAEYETLPGSMQKGIRRFFDQNEIWLTKVVEDGRRDRHFQRRGTARETARTFLAALEGAMLVARSYDDTSRFAVAAKYLLAGLEYDKSR